MQVCDATIYLSIYTHYLEYLTYTNIIVFNESFIYLMCQMETWRAIWSIRRVLRRRPTHILAFAIFFTYCLLYVMHMIA